MATSLQGPQVLPELWHYYPDKLLSRSFYLSPFFYPSKHYHIHRDFPKCPAIKIKFSIAIKKIVLPFKNLSDRKVKVKNLFFFIIRPILNKLIALSRAINNSQPKIIGRIIHLFFILASAFSGCIS
jgi:hypothetical protein